MRNVKIKIRCDDNVVSITLAHPQADIGANNDFSLETISINNVPNDIDNSTVIRLVNQSAYFPDNTERRNEFDYSELIPGKIIRQ